MGCPGGTVVKNLPASAGCTRDMGSIPGSGRSPEEGNGNPPQYSCLENPMDKGAWRATVHGLQRVDKTEQEHNNNVCVFILIHMYGEYSMYTVFST